MKLSEYHSSHGLQGQLKLTQTGQTFDFRFHKGEDRLHIKAIIAGVHTDAWLVAEKIPTENPDDMRDMRLTVLVQAAPMADAMDTRRKEAAMVELPRPAAPVAAPVAAPPPVVVPPPAVAPAPVVEPRIRVAIDVDGMPMAAGGDMNDDAPEENREPVTATPAKTQPTEGWEQPNEVPFVGLNAAPKQAVEPTTPNDGVIRSVDKDAAAAQALGGSAPSTVPDADAALFTPPHFGPGPTNPGEVNRSVRDGMVQMDRMSGNVEQEAPRRRRR
jgi:hypothetical protein